MVGFAEEVDSIKKSFLKNLLGVTDPEYFDKVAFPQAQLHIRDGGLGLLNTLDLIHPAFLAGFSNCRETLQTFIPELDVRFPFNEVENQSYLQVLPTLTSIKGSMGILNKFPTLKDKDLWNLQAFDTHTRQEWLSSPSRQFRIDELMAILRENEATHHDQIRILSCKGSDQYREGAAWLEAVPKTPYLTMSDVEFRVALKFRLGLSLAEYLPVDRTCSCTAHIDDRGLHLTTGCGYGAQQTRTRTHNNIVTQLHGVLRWFGFETVKEDREIFADHHTHSIPDITLHKPPLFNNKPAKAELILDVTITNPLSDSKLNKKQPHTVPCHAAAAAASQKVSKYKKNGTLSSAEHDFLPVAIETYGAMNKEFLEMLEKTATKASEHLDIPDHILFRYALKTLSIELQRSLAKGIVKRSASLIRNKDVTEDDNEFQGDYEEIIDIHSCRVNINPCPRR